MQEEFTHGDAKKVFPWLKSRTLISWTERGLIIPDIQDAMGRGSVRKYSYRNLVEIAFVDTLLNRELLFSEIRQIIEDERYCKIIREGKWDTVFLSRRQIVSANVQMDISPPWVGGVDFVDIRNFANNTGSYFFEYDEKSFGSHITSAIIIFFDSLERFVRGQIEKQL